MRRRYSRTFVLEAARAVSRGHAGARIGKNVKLSGPGRIVLGRGSHIAEGTHVWVGPGATLTLGRGAKIGPRNIINVAAGIAIGARCEISWDVQLLDTDFHWLRTSPERVTTPAAPIELGEHVLVGTGAMILKGVTIGAGAVIGAGSVVRRDVPPGSVVAGNPASVVGEVLDWGTGEPPSVPPSS